MYMVLKWNWVKNSLIRNAQYT